MEVRQRPGGGVVVQRASDRSAIYSRQVCVGRRLTSRPTTTGSTSSRSWTNPAANPLRPGGGPHDGAEYFVTYCSASSKPSSDSKRYGLTEGDSPGLPTPQPAPHHYCNPRLVPSACFLSCARTRPSFSASVPSRESS